MLQSEKRHGERRMDDIGGERERMESELHWSPCHEKMYLYGKCGHFKYKEMNISETLRASGGDIGGGSESIVVTYRSRRGIK